MPDMILPMWTPDFIANAGLFTFGHVWRSNQSIAAVGIFWWQPPSDGPSSVKAVLYSIDGDILVSGVSQPQMINAWNFIPFDVPFISVIGVDYVACAVVDAAHGYTVDAGFPITDPSGTVTIPVDGGRFSANDIFPTNSWGGLHGVQLAFNLPSAGPAVYVWDGSQKVPAVGIYVWDGSQKVPATIKVA